MQKSGGISRITREKETYMRTLVAAGLLSLSFLDFFWWIR